MMTADWEAYAKTIEADLAQLKRDLVPLVSGKMTIGEREGNGPWRDVTQETIDHDKKVIETYEAILKDVRTNKIRNH